jgi:hypothetical protein
MWILARWAGHGAESELKCAACRTQQVDAEQTAEINTMFVKPMHLAV